MTFALHVSQGSGGVIPGLKEVLVGMQPGGKRRALIPPSEGYLSEGLEPQVWPESYYNNTSIVRCTDFPTPS